jgi:hypothetical protein
VLLGHSLAEFRVIFIVSSGLHLHPAPIAGKHGFEDAVLVSAVISWCKNCLQCLWLDRSIAHLASDFEVALAVLCMHSGSEAVAMDSVLACETA